MNNNDDIENKIYFSKYKPEKKIGEGSFGKIYSAVNIYTNEKFALKLELKSSGQNLLESEAYVLCYLKGHGIPIVKSYGFSGDYNILVMELLYKSLEDLFQECGCRFSIKTVCMIADQMLTRIEYIHQKHIIHRDIKPDNFVMGLDENKDILYLIDFGLAKKFRSSRTLQHIKFMNNKKLTGTARYASINALKGCEQSRRDDLEAIGYVLMYFLRGSLPWQGLKIDKREDRYKKIYEKKKSTTSEELCEGFPTEFCEYINYAKNLGFEDDPDYNFLRDLFRRIMERNGDEYDYVFDWTKKHSLENRNINTKINMNMSNNINASLQVNQTLQNFNNPGCVSNENLNNIIMKNKENLQDNKENILNQNENKNIYLPTNPNENQKLRNITNADENKNYIPTDNYQNQNLRTSNNNLYGNIPTQYENNRTNMANLNTLVQVTKEDNNKNEIKNTLNNRLVNVSNTNVVTLNNQSNTQPKDISNIKKENEKNLNNMNKNKLTENEKNNNIMGNMSREKKKKKCTIL